MRSLDPAPLRGRERPIDEYPDVAIGVALAGGELPKRPSFGRLRTKESGSGWTTADSPDPACALGGDNPVIIRTDHQTPSCLRLEVAVASPYSVTTVTCVGA